MPATNASAARSCCRQRVAAALVIAVLVLFAVACAGTNQSDDAPAVRVLERDAHCPEPPASAGAVRIESDHGGADAGDSWVVRLGMGQRSTSGYRVDVADLRPVSVDAGVAVVRVDWTTPAPDAAVGQVITRPCVEVAVPRVYEGVRFIDQDGALRGEAARGEAAQ